MKKFIVILDPRKFSPDKVELWSYAFDVSDTTGALIFLDEEGGWAGYFKSGDWFYVLSDVMVSVNPEKIELKDFAQ